MRVQRVAMCRSFRRASRSERKCLWRILPRRGGVRAVFCPTQAARAPHGGTTPQMHGDRHGRWHARGRHSQKNGVSYLSCEWSASKTQGYIVERYLIFVGPCPFVTYAEF